MSVGKFSKQSIMFIHSLHIQPSKYVVLIYLWIANDLRHCTCKKLGTFSSKSNLSWTSSPAIIWRASQDGHMNWHSRWHLSIVEWSGRRGCHTCSKMPGFRKRKLVGHGKRNFGLEMCLTSSLVSRLVLLSIY